MSAAERDGRLRETLDRAAGAIDPDPDGRLDEVRRRGSARRAGRWTAISLALAVFVAALGWGAVQLRGGDAVHLAGDGGRWVDYRNPGIGWTASIPAGWRTGAFSMVCGARFAGSVIANVGTPSAPSLVPVAGSSCTRTPPVGSGSAPAAGSVIVEFDRRFGGPPVADIPDSEVPLPLSLAGVRGVADGGLTRYDVAVQAGRSLLSVRVWFGPLASPADRAAARRIVASLRPAATTPAPPGTVTVTPASGPVGTAVHLEGDGFADAAPSLNGRGGYGISFLRDLPGGCEAVAPAEGTWRVDPAGHLVADVTVPSTAGCFQGSGASRVVTPGTWTIVAGCHACRVGSFEVTGAAPPYGESYQP